MTIRFIHTADLHLGKTYRTTSGESGRYEDFFTALSTIVVHAVRAQVDFFLIAGDLFHVGQILPRTFARTVQILQPLKDAAIPCVAVEGNHDWIHRRDSISWMETLSHMGYINLLRPVRTADGGYRFDPFDRETGTGGRIEIRGCNIYGVGYIGAQAGLHVPRICEAVATEKNILLFHAGVWTFSPVEIGNMKPEEALPLSEVFDYVALGHGHKPYIISTPEGRPYAFNPGSPERVNFGEEAYGKGFYCVSTDEQKTCHTFRPTDPRPMISAVIDLDGAQDADAALAMFRAAAGKRLSGQQDERQPLLELKIVGRVRFHPFELGRERLCAAIEGICSPLHVEIKNHLSLVTREGEGESIKRSLAEIEREVLRELVTAGSAYKGREDELVRLSLSIRDLVQKGDVEGEELLGLLGDI